jgi:hypothetical protein
MQFLNMKGVRNEDIVRLQSTRKKRKGKAARGPTRDPDLFTIPLSCILIMKLALYMGGHSCKNKRIQSDKMQGGICKGTDYWRASENASG